MFCTPKEQETCDVEKRTCEGCYYMNEEKIINRIKYRVNELKLAYAIDNIDLEAIQGLLNLYQQAKEKNKKLEEKIIKLQMSHYQIHQMNKRLIKQLQES